jgi:hypothetical protein
VCVDGWDLNAGFSGLYYPSLFGLRDRLLQVKIIAELGKSALNANYATL